MQLAMVGVEEPSQNKILHYITSNSPKNRILWELRKTKYQIFSIEKKNKQLTTNTNDLQPQEYKVKKNKLTDFRCIRDTSQYI